jgi:hypothetical protein
MITQLNCTCGNTDPQKAYEYDGMLGYEAIVCTVCGRYYDHVGTGEHEADEWSQQFVTGETQPEKAPTMYKGYIIQKHKGKLGAYSYRTDYHINYLYNTWEQLKSVIDALKDDPVEELLKKPII